MADVRSQEARARAETALARLLHGLEEVDVEIIVLGGLVPDVLTRDRGIEKPAHLGTTDVDILLVTRLDREDDLSAVERSLLGLGFAAEKDGWRWSGTIDGKRVKIEFLCDLETVKQGDLYRPAECEELSACNLRGTRFVAMDHVGHELRALTEGGEEITVMAQFAGLQGYLLSKCFAVRYRGAPKDYYDLPYVLRYNRQGGPREAAELLLAGDLSGELPGLQGLFREIRGRYENPNDNAPQRYAEEMLLVKPELDPRVLRTDAVVAVATFLDVLLPGR